MENGVLMWTCKKCGACCEVLFPLLFGKDCEHYDKKTHLCRTYESRPEICRAKHQFGEEVTKRMCAFLRKIRGKSDVERRI